MKLIKLTHMTTGECMHVTPATTDAQVFLSVHLAAYGVRAELVDTDEKQGIASGTRFPNRTPLGEHLFREGVRLARTIGGR